MPRRSNAGREASGTKRTKYRRESRQNLRETCVRVAKTCARVAIFPGFWADFRMSPPWIEKISYEYQSDNFFKTRAERISALETRPFAVARGQLPGPPAGGAKPQRGAFVVIAVERGHEPQFPPSRSIDAQERAP